MPWCSRDPFGTAPDPDIRFCLQNDDSVSREWVPQGVTGVSDAKVQGDVEQPQGSLRLCRHRRPEGLLHLAGPQHRPGAASDCTSNRDADDPAGTDHCQRVLYGHKPSRLDAQP